MTNKFQLIFILAPFLSMWGTLSVPLSQKLGDFTPGTEVIIVMPEEERMDPLTTIIPTKEAQRVKYDNKEVNQEDPTEDINSRTLSSEDISSGKVTSLRDSITATFSESTEDTKQELSPEEPKDEEITKDSMGEVSEKRQGESECPTDCSSEVTNNICTNIGKVYESECHMRKENCGKDVYSVDWEHCRGKHPLCPDNCLLLYDPVCGHDGRVYTNLCVLHSSNCGRSVVIHEMQFCLSKAREFRDVDACPRQCQEIYEPACGSDGQVYMNECFLRLYNCGKKVDMVDMDKCIDAPECPSTCTSIYDPVCGSDGKIYLNYCRFIRDNCGKDVEKRPRSFCEEKMLLDQKELNAESSDA